MMIPVLITWCSYMVASGWSSILFYHYHNIYDKYELYYLYDWIQYVISIFSSSLLMNHLFLNGYYNHSFKFNVIITFIVTILINGTTITLLLWQHHEYNNYIWYWKWVCNNILINNESFQSRCKQFLSIDALYIYAIVYPLCLFLVIFLNHIHAIFLTFRNLNKSKKMLTQELSKVETIELSHLDESLLQSTPRYSYSHNQDHDAPMNEKLACSFVLCIVLILVLFLFFCQMFFVQMILYYYTKNINYYFYCLLFSTSCSKLLLKYISKKIDINNMNRNKNYNNINCNYNCTAWYHYVSLELFIEFGINFVYFLNYYELFIHELSSKQIYKVFLLIFFHLLSESCQSILRFSSIYFKITKILYKTIQHYHTNDVIINYNNINTKKNKMSQKFLSVLLNIFEDDSNIDEWRIRHSIDSCIRCISFICSFSLFAIRIAIIPSTEYLVSKKSNYYRGLFYCCLSFSCDLIYFLLIFLFNYCFNNHLNIWKPIMLIYAANDKFVLLVSFLSAMLALFVGG